MIFVQEKKNTFLIQDFNNISLVLFPPIYDIFLTAYVPTLD